MVLHDVIAWVEREHEARRSTDARYLGRAGYLTLQHTTGPGGTTTKLYLRRRNVRRNQYSLVTDSLLDRLEIMGDSGRYQPAAQVLMAETAA